MTQDDTSEQAASDQLSTVRFPRVTLQFAVLFSVALSLLIPSIGAYFLERQHARENARQELEADLGRSVDILAASLNAPLWELSTPSAQAIVDAMIKDKHFVSIIVWQSGKDHPFIEARQQASQESDELKMRRPILWNGDEIGAVEVTMTLAPYIADYAQRVQRNFLMLSVLLLTALSSITWILRHRLLRPIKQLTKAANQIANEDLSTPIQTEREDEIGHVATAMDNMRQRLLASFRELQERNLQLGESESRARIIIEASPIPLVMINGQDEITFVNQGFVQAIGYTTQDIPTLALWFSHAFPDRQYRDSVSENWQKNLAQAKRSGKPFAPMELDIHCKDGARLTFIISIAVLEKDYSGSYLLVLYDITDRKEAEKQINDLAFYDRLTGLPNRTLLLERLKHNQAENNRSGNFGALLVIDLDNFKMLNNTLGHDVGDQLLKQVAQRLTGCLRESDTVARLGGDEFGVILENLASSQDEAAARTEAAGKNILSVFDKSYQLNLVVHHSTASIGATLFQGSSIAIDELMKQADLSMYKAKSAGRNRICFFDPAMEASIKQRMALQEEMIRALDEQQFLLYYQPQVAGERIIGTEALLRWQHAERGMISPGDFIPIAEETGLILLLGQFVLEAACQQLAEWAKQPAMAHLTIAINVSALQFRQHNFVSQVLTTLENTAANPQRLKLELTETILVDNVDETIKKMFLLKASGVSFSLDDFGTGYSSLSYLKRLPLDQLKIDQSFVRDILSDPNDAAIAKTVVALAQSLGIGVIAEGVETEAQRDFLANAGCHAYQGYLFSRPLPLEKFNAFAQTRL
ncbi:MAG: EAL domain-containing protein [Dechloromonas sp.]|nr:EAL domain-containing protein [Dechloromonas sp.]